MSNHVLKPVLIGLLVLVVLVAIIVLVYSSAPQASEITGPSPSPTVATTTTTYTQAYPGMAECADGQDNDGDELSDWSDTADSSTTDPDCVSARDRSEQYAGDQ